MGFFALCASLLLAPAAFEILDHVLDASPNSRVFLGVWVQANCLKSCLCALERTRAFIIFYVWICPSLAEVFHSFQMPTLGRHEHRTHQERAALVHLEPFGNQESEHVRACAFVRGSVQG